MKVCLIGCGGIGMSYDFTTPTKLETHYSALSHSDVIESLVCIDPDNQYPQVNNDWFSCVTNLPETLSLDTDIFVISVPTNLHKQTIIDIFKNKVKKNAVFVIEKPVGKSLAELDDISIILKKYKVYVNYMRRSSKLNQYLTTNISSHGLKKFECEFEGSWSNIGSHFIDYFLFLTRDGLPNYVNYSNDVLEIHNGDSIASFRQVKFKKKSFSPYRFTISNEKGIWTADQGGDLLRFVSTGSDESILICEDGLSQYQKHFYEHLFDPNLNDKLATLSDARSVHKILETINV